VWPKLYKNVKETLAVFLSRGEITVEIDGSANHSAAGLKSTAWLLPMRK